MPTDKKTTDAYNENVDKWVSAKRNNPSEYHIYYEKPAMNKKLPDLNGRSVLCIGCGSGEEVEYLSNKGVANIVGIDLSEGLIKKAKESYPELDFRVMDMEHLDFPKDSFDFVYSSLTMHYIDSWSNVLTSVKKVSKNNSTFLFSMSHPFFTAMDNIEDDKIKKKITGFIDFKDTKEWEICGDYFTTRPFEVGIMKKAFNIINVHRPFSELVKDIKKAGFEIIDIEEPKALDESKEKYKRFWEIHQRIPEFIIFEIENRK